MFITLKRNPVSISRHFPSPLLSPWYLLVYFPSLDLPLLDISYRWNHVMCDRLCLAPFTVFKVHPCCSIISTSLLFLEE